MFRRDWRVAATRWLVDVSAAVRGWPAAARWGLGAALAVAAYWGRVAGLEALGVDPRALPYMPYFGAIVACAMVLNGGSAVAAALTGAVLAALEQPLPGGWVGLGFFISMALLIAGLVEALRGAHDRLAAAVAALTAALAADEAHAAAMRAAAEREAAHAAELARSRAELERHAAALEAEVARGRALAGRLDLALREKDHRVNNNLAELAALMTLMRKPLTTDEAKAVLERLSARVREFSIVNNLLFEARDTPDTAIDAGAFVERLLGAVLGQGVAAVEGVRWRVEHGRGSSVTLGYTRAGAVAKIVTEWVRNAVKHAFPDGRGGEVVVALRREGAEVVLEVADDGVGPERHAALVAARAGGGGGLGRGLVRTLATRTLGGTVETRANPAGRGTLCVLRFPAGSGRAPNPARGGGDDQAAVS